MTNFWQNKYVIVTGGNGFLGTHLVSELKSKGCIPFVPRSNHFDLRQTAYIDALLKNGRVDILFHLAGNVGGIGYNLERPYTLFYDNAIMGIKLIDAAIKYGIKKFVQVGTVCSYPSVSQIPFMESDLWSGYPEKTNAPYGIAKKILLTQLQAAREEFDFNGIYLIPTNLYGAGDEFADHRSHVIPALIKKFVDAKENQSIPKIWGYGGSITRDFLYVSDAVKAIVKAAEIYNMSIPINIGSGEEISISQLVYRIANLTGYSGKIEWDKSKPEGQRRRVLSIEESKSRLQWRPEISLEQGLKATIKWYQEEKLNA